MCACMYIPLLYICVLECVWVGGRRGGSVYRKVDIHIRYTHDLHPFSNCPNPLFDASPVNNSHTCMHHITSYASHDVHIHHANTRDSSTSSFMTNPLFFFSSSFFFLPSLSRFE